MPLPGGDKSTNDMERTAGTGHSAYVYRCHIRMRPVNPT